MSMERMDDPAERVFAALRETEPPVGMEQRLVDSVRLRARSQANRSGGHVRVLVLAGAAAACVAIGGAVLFSLHAAAPQSNTTMSSSQTGAVLRRRAGDPTQPLILRRTVTPVSRRARATHDGSSTEASRGMARVVSRPAPPAPLTQQEKLLLQLAATRDTRRTELLNPEIQQERQMEAKAEFDRFFNVRHTGENE